MGGWASVHALTDVTGFGLLGHALEMAHASRAVLRIAPGAIPLLPRAAQWARDGLVTGASARNWASVADWVELAPDLPQWSCDLLTDPQTSGGLLVAVAPDRAADGLAAIRAAGFAEAAVIGRVDNGPGPGRVVVAGPQAAG